METSSTLRCRNVWHFAQGSKFKADFYSKMSVYIHKLGLRVQPLTPGNSNPGRHLAHRPHTPISIAPACALALVPTLPPASDSWCRPCQCLNYISSVLALPFYRSTQYSINRQLSFLFFDVINSARRASQEEWVSPLSRPRLMPSIVDITISLDHLRREAMLQTHSCDR